MLKNTFIHIPGIGIKTEERLWDSGILDWDDFKEPFEINLSPKKLESIKLKDTPFLQTHQLPIHPLPDVPFKADRNTLDRIKGQFFV